MTDKRKLKIPAPAIAIALIVIIAIVAERRVVGPTSESPTATPVEETTPEPAPIAAAPFETPISSIWSTYHGGPKLGGMTDAAIPDKPSVLWRFQADNSLYYTPVQDEGGIYFSTYRGHVYALDFDGNLRWSKRLIREIKDDGTVKHERIDAPVAAFLSTIFVGTLDGKLYALDAETGEERWIYNVGGPILGTVNLFNPGDDPDDARLLLIGQEDGSLHSIIAATGERDWQAEAIDRCDGSASVGNGVIVYGSCANALHVFSAEDGALLKNIELDLDSQVASGTALAGDSVFSGSHSGRFFHASISSGELLWINEDSLDEIFTTPAVGHELVIFGSYDGNIYALDRATGERRWTFESDGYPTSAVIAGDKVIFGIDGVLYLLALKSGEVLWSYEVSDEITSAAIINGMTIVGSEDGTVTAFGAKQP